MGDELPMPMWPDSLSVESIAETVRRLNRPTDASAQFAMAIGAWDPRVDLRQALDHIASLHAALTARGIDPWTLVAKENGDPAHNDRVVRTAERAARRLTRRKDRENR